MDAQQLEQVNSHLTMITNRLEQAKMNQKEHQAHANEFNRKTQEKMMQWAGHMMPGGPRHMHPGFGPPGMIARMRPQFPHGPIPKPRNQQEYEMMQQQQQRMMMHGHRGVMPMARPPYYEVGRITSHSLTYAQCLAELATRWPTLICYVAAGTSLQLDAAASLGNNTEVI